MNEMDNRKKVKKQSSPIVIKRCYPDLASMSNEERIDHYLKTREMKFQQIKMYAPKSVNIVRQEISPGASLAADRVISLDKDMTLDGQNLKRKHKKNIVQNFPVTASTNGNNDRLVIELSDYLTLTKTKNIGKFILKPMSSKSDKVNPLSPIDKIIQTANTVSLDQVLNGRQKIKTEVDISNQEPQRTFLLVPQYKIPHKLGEPVSKKIKLCHDQTIAKKSKTQPTCESSNPAKVLQNIGTINPSTPNTQLSSILQGSKHFFVKIPVSNVQEPNPQLSEKSVKRLKIAIKKIQHTDLSKSSVANGSTTKKKFKVQHVDHTLSVTNKSTVSPKQKKKKVNIQHTNCTPSVANESPDSEQGKKKMNVVLRAHPYFSQHKPFIIKHQPASAKATKHQSYPLEDQPGNLSNSEFSVVSISEPSKLVEEIKYEMPEQDINFMVTQDSEQSESIDQVFPVALTAPDSDDFEYLRFEDNSEILTESDMQILGI